MNEPASIRFKNPGAMWGSALAIKWGAEKKAVTLNDGKGQGNNIAVFPTYVQGICAQLDLWRTSKNYRGKKFCDAIAIWSGQNSVESYIAFVLARVPGMSRNTVMDDAFWRSSMGIAFLKAQAWHEAGKRYPAPDADWIEAQRIVFSGAKAPAITEASPAPSAGDPEVAAVQRRLDAMGYPPGVQDGKWGGMTAGAIAGFKNDRGLSGEPVIDAALKAELTKAEGEGFKRPIAKARAEATTETVAKSAPEIIPVQQTKKLGIWATITSLVLAAINAVADYFQDAMTWVGAIKSSAGDLPAYVWFIVAALVTMAMAYAARNGAKGIIEAFRKGERA